MKDTVTRYLNSMINVRDQAALRPIINALANLETSYALNTSGLVIKAGGSALAKTGASDFYAIANGTLVKIAASTDMPALTGTITAGSYNVYVFYVDSAGTTSVAQGTEATTLAGVKFPEPPALKAMIGFLLVTYASTFTGGTTPLDTATTVYFSPTGNFDPTVLI